MHFDLFEIDEWICCINSILFIEFINAHLPRYNSLDSIPIRHFPFHFSIFPMDVNVSNNNTNKHTQLLHSYFFKTTLVKYLPAVQHLYSPVNMLIMRPMNEIQVVKVLFTVLQTKIDFMIVLLTSMMVPFPQIGWYESQNMPQVPVKHRFSSGFGDI